MRDASPKPGRPCRTFNRAALAATCFAISPMVPNGAAQQCRPSPDVGLARTIPQEANVKYEWERLQPLVSTNHEKTFGIQRKNGWNRYP